MYLNKLLLSSVLATLAVALPEPQTPAQSTQVVDDLASYISALATDPALLSYASAAATQPGALESLAAFQSSLQSDIMNTITPASDFLKALPTDAQSLFGSVYTAELSIMSKDGFTSGAALASSTGTETNTAKTTGTASGTAAGTAASSSSSQAAAPTMGLSGVKVGGAVAAGILGVALAL